VEGFVGAGSVRHPIDGKVSLPQGGLQPLCNHSIVFDEQDTHAGSFRRP
jgi:hypothetical protein